MPDAGEFPRMLAAVVPLVCAGITGILKLVADRLPCLAAVVGALDDLPEPATGLRRVNPVRIHRRTLEMIDFPTGKVWAADVPFLASFIRGQDERALACPDQHSHLTHVLLLFSAIRGARLNSEVPLLRDATLASHRSRLVQHRQIMSEWSAIVSNRFACPYKPNRYSIPA